MARKRPEFIESNRMALLAGYQWVRDNIQDEVPFRLAQPTRTHEQELVMSGNRAIVAGALAAGCRYFAGYPITPASDILEEMAKRLPDDRRRHSSRPRTRLRPSAAWWAPPSPGSRP